jgi:hypothetical protein
MDGFFEGRSDEEIERIKKTLEVAFPRPEAAPKMELSSNGIPVSLVEAEDILITARKLADAIYLMALDLDECERGAICSVADVIRDKITESLELIKLGKKKLSGRAEYESV